MSHPIDDTPLAHRPDPHLDPRLDAAWRDDRRYVLDIALRILGDLGNAEDAVQEAFTRLFRSDIDEIDDVRAWLVTVVSRVCLDQLRSARRRPQAPFDTGDGREPTPSATSPGTGPGTATQAVAANPADRVTLDDSVRLALQVMLQRLSPAERTAFVLHDVFQLSFDDIAGIVGRTPAACRQLASRARRQVRADGPGRFSVESTEQRAVTERFIAACTTGDLDALLAVLDPRVSAAGDDALAWRDLYTGWKRRLLDLATRVFGQHRPVRRVTGRKRIARGAMRYLGPRHGTTLVSVPTPGDPSVLALLDGKAVALITLTISDGRITHAHAVADPAELAPITAALRD
jgi:RNA polymerase sigma-70 factor (ECF subfamily)